MVWFLVHIYFFRKIRPLPLRHIVDTTLRHVNPLFFPTDMMRCATLLLAVLSLAASAASFVAPQRRLAQHALRMSSATPESSSSTNNLGRREVLSGLVGAFSAAGVSAPAFALKDPSGMTTGSGKYDVQMDPLTATAMYGTGKAQIEARKAIRAKGGKVPTPR